MLSILHGGNGLPILAWPVYNYIVTGLYSNIVVPVSEIPEGVLKFTIGKVIKHFVVVVVVFYLILYAVERCRNGCRFAYYLVYG